MEKPDQKKCEEFLARCLKLLQCDLDPELLLITTEGSNLGSHNGNLAARTGRVEVFYVAQDSQRELEETIAHEAMEAALHPLWRYLETVLNENQRQFAWDLLHNGLFVPLPEILAEAARKKEAG